MGRRGRISWCDELVVLGILLGVAAPVSALDPEQAIHQYVARTWTIEHGMPQNSANALVQDNRGYLWVATFGGLARFDGVRFEVFRAAEEPGLASDRITALFETTDGELWIGTERSGVSVFRDGHFSPFEAPGGVHYGPPLGRA